MYEQAGHGADKRQGGPETIDAAVQDAWKTPHVTATTQLA